METGFNMRFLRNEGTPRENTSVINSVINLGTVGQLLPGFNLGFPT